MVVGGSNGILSGSGCYVMGKGQVYEMQYLSDEEKEIINARRMLKKSECLFVNFHPKFTTKTVLDVENEERAEEWLRFFGATNYSKPAEDGRMFISCYPEQISVVLKEVSNGR